MRRRNGSAARPDVRKDELGRRLARMVVQWERNLPRVEDPAWVEVTPERWRQMVAAARAVLKKPRPPSGR